MGLGNLTEQWCVICGHKLREDDYPHYTQRWCFNESCKIYSCVVANALYENKSNFTNKNKSTGE